MYLKSELHNSTALELEQHALPITDRIIQGTSTKSQPDDFVFLLNEKKICCTPAQDVPNMDHGLSFHSLA